MVDVLSANGGSNALAVGGVFNAPLVGKASLILDEGPLGSISVTVVKLAVLDCSKLGSVCLGEDLAVLDGLNSAVVVILVDLLVNGSVDLLVYMGLDNLVVYSGGNCLVDSGVVVAGPAHELGDGCLCFVHFEVVVVWLFVVEGVKTTIPFHLALMDSEDFQAGNFTTKFLESFDFSVV